MAYTTPKTWAYKETLSSADMNTYISDNLTALRSDIRNNTAARAKRSDIQTIGNASWTKVQFNTESFDVGSNYDNATNYRFTAPVTGYYLVNTLITWGNISGEDHYTKIYKNGTGIITSAIHGITGNAYIQTITDIVPLTAAQYVEVFVYQNSGGNENITAESYISVALVSY